MTSRSRSTPQVHQIKAIFEGYRHPTSRPEHSSRGKSYNSQQSADDMKTHTEQSEQVLLAPEPANTIAETIESVIETPVHNNRPKLNSKPSWVGPLPRSRAPSPGAQAMSRKVTVSYEAPDLLPPVYITTTLSKPQWEIIEMDATKHDQGYIFHKEFDSSEGEQQYKFRLGPGDWWVCDENKPTIEDDDGNRNNVLYITREQTLQAAPEKKYSAVGPTPIAVATADKSEQAPAALPPSTTTDLQEQAAAGAMNPSLPARDSVLNLTAAGHHIVFKGAKEEHESSHPADEPVPLLKHETTYPGQIEEDVHGTLTGSPSASASSKSSAEDIVCPEADPDDTSLHGFPTNHAGIVREIQRAQRSLPEDVATGEASSSPSSRKGSGLSALTTPLLPGVQEEEPEILVMISDSEEASPVLSPSQADKQRWFNPSNGPAHHHNKHEHHHPKIAEEDMKEEKPNNKKALSDKRNNLSDLGDIFFGVTFAAVVAVGAFVLYSTGILGVHDAVKDGGAALGS